MDDYGVLDRLIFNQKSPNDAEALANVLGLVHLYRTSGVHLLAFFSFIKWVVQWFGKRLGLRAEHAELFSLILSAVCIFWIWSLQDYRPTLIRPILTFLFRAFFKVRGAQSRILLPLGLTFLSEVFLSPDSSFTEGALHYYLSVAGGLVAYHFSQNSPPFLRHVSLALGSWLPMAIISLVQGHIISYLTPVYSLISLPVISVVLYPLTLMDLLINKHISGVTILLWNGFTHLLFSLPDLGPTFLSVDSFALWLALPCSLIAIFLLRKLCLKEIPIAQTLLALLILCGGRMALAERAYAKEVVQLDVGQGDSALIKDGMDRTEMVDVGSLKAYNVRDWIEKLSRHEVQSVDSILLSHLDEDHVGALKELLFLMPVGCVQTNAALWASERGMRLAEFIKSAVPETKISSGDCMMLPQITWLKSSKGGGNELMAGIFYAPNDHEAYLAAGDADEEQEIEYEHFFWHEIETHPIRILKISHHGSRFSSSLKFLHDVNPDSFWISVGRHNPYHHPHPTTLFKLNTLSGRVYRTDVAGDVSRSFSE